MLPVILIQWSNGAIYNLHCASLLKPVVLFLVFFVVVRAKHQESE